MEEINKTIPELILRIQGIDVSKYEGTFLSKSIQKRMSETHCDTLDDYDCLLQSQEEEAEHLIDSLQISYTEFFRNPLTFSVLEKIVIPNIVARNASSHRNEIRIWSAACAAGQETYSLAMLLKEFSNGYPEEINFRIFATDQSESQIRDAQLGQYPESALNCLSLKRVNRWFKRRGGNYTVREELKKNIEFSVFDLFNKQYSCPPTSIFGDFDLIVCANLLFYYRPKFRKKIIEKAGNCLATNGYLITGETERDILMQSGFQEVYPQSAIFQI